MTIDQGIKHSRVTVPYSLSTTYKQKGAENQRPL